MKTPTKRAIACALGISGPAFSRYVARGCPTWSIDAARRWQEQNIDPAQRLARMNGARHRDSERDAVLRILEGALLAKERHGGKLTAAELPLVGELAALACGDFRHLEMPMRGLLELVPAELYADALERLPMPLVMLLTDGVRRACNESIAAGEIQTSPDDEPIDLATLFDILSGRLRAPGRSIALVTTDPPNENVN